jgi:DNA-binding Lrp family transcriptional regulator
MIAKKDMEILNILKDNCKMPSKEISMATGIPMTTVHNRIKRMEKNGVIRGYKAVIDGKKIGKGIQAFVHLEATQAPAEELARKISAFPEVEECHVVSGTNELIIRIASADPGSLNDFISDKIGKMKGVSSKASHIILKSIE